MSNEQRPAEDTEIFWEFQTSTIDIYEESTNDSNDYFVRIIVLQKKKCE